MTQPTEPPHPRSPTPASVGAEQRSPVRAVSSESLFDGAQELHIQHRGTLYRLRQTSLGKLILTK